MTTNNNRRKEYMNNYNKGRKDEVYYTLMKRNNNKLSYLRKHHNLTDDNAEYQAWKLLYPELISIKEHLQNVNIIISNNTQYTHLKDKLHDLINEICVTDIPQAQSAVRYL
jgi:hypothetical protein